MYIYIYIHTYIHMCVYVCVYIYIYIYLLTGSNYYNIASRKTEFSFWRVPCIRNALCVTSSSEFGSDAKHTGALR